MSLVGIDRSWFDALAASQPHSSIKEGPQGRSEMKQAPSFLLAFFGGCGALAGILALQSSAPASVSNGDGTNANAQSGPRPRDLVRIIEGETYVVPGGRILTIKTLTSAKGGMGRPVLKINGQLALGGQDVYYGPTEFVLGVAARSGETVVVEDEYVDPETVVVALGYLERP